MVSFGNFRFNFFEGLITQTFPFLLTKIHIFPTNSSLLIVYEGYEEQPLNPMDDQCCPNSDNFSAINVNDDDNDDSHIDSYCYDADASNDSADMNLSSSHEDSDHHHHHHHHQHQHGNKNRSQSHITNQQHSHDQLLNVNDEVSTDFLQRGYGEAAARGAANNKLSSGSASAPFIPISEDTVFLDAVNGVGTTTSTGGGSGGVGVDGGSGGGGCSSSSSIPGISTSSPMSGDSWMNYSSNSSDDYSCISEQLHSSVGADRTTISVINNKGTSGGKKITTTTGDSTDASSSDFETSITESVPKLNFEHLLLRNNDELKDKKEATTMMTTSTPTKQIAGGSSQLQQQQSIKRQRGKDITKSSGASTININNNNNKRRHSNISALRRNSSVGSGSGSSGNSGPSVDIRVIDFAHTAFVRKSGSTTLSTSSTSVQHQGPDSGFLRGLDSLKRLLSEICAEDH